MNTWSEFEKQFNEIEARISSLVQHFDNHAELEESLQIAGSGLRDANNEVKLLAESAKSATDSLRDILNHFTEAVEILRQADPTRTIKAVESVEERFLNAVRGIMKAIQDAVEVLSSGQVQAGETLTKEASEIRNAVSAAVTDICEQIVSAENCIKEANDVVIKGVSEAREKTDERVSSEAQEIKKAIPTVVCYVTLALVVAVVGMEIFRFFPAS